MFLYTFTIASEYLGLATTNKESSSIEDETVTALLTSPIRELFQDLVPDEQLKKAARKKVKSRYSCPHCQKNVWGKPGQKLLCGECGEAYEEKEAA